MSEKCMCTTNESTNELVEKVKTKLIDITGHYDTEMVHIVADEALCELLRGLGYNEIVDIFEKIDKWYA